MFSPLTKVLAIISGAMFTCTVASAIQDSVLDNMTDKELLYLKSEESEDPDFRATINRQIRNSIH